MKIILLKDVLVIIKFIKDMVVLVWSEKKWGITPNKKKDEKKKGTFLPYYHLVYDGFPYDPTTCCVCLALSQTLGEQSLAPFLAINHAFASGYVILLWVTYQWGHPVHKC